LNKPQPTVNIDVALIGGGIAGAWLLNLLSSRGYSAVLLEADSLGCDQTLASQGMIHGGLKYALGGALTGASEAIAGMPDRWRACLQGKDGTSRDGTDTARSGEGRGDVDLTGLKLLSNEYYMYANDTGLGQVTAFLASRALRGRIKKVRKSHWPEAFNGFDGVVYRLNDFVVDTPALLQRLTQGHEDRILKLRCTGDNVQSNASGYAIQLDDVPLQAQHLISCAGNGSQSLLKALNIDLKVQQRPLKQVLVIPKQPLQMYAHCLIGVKSNEPRLTITTHPIVAPDDGSARVVWYLGGQLATQGVTLSDDEQIATAKRELEICVPWMYWQDAEFDTLTINRAEPYQATGARPDCAYAERVGQFIQCFPTKLTLAPDLGDRVIALLDPPSGCQTRFVTNHQRAAVGQPQWLR
jgi:glycine/D-amino acid oxidase-like deaminating enzyme